MNLPSVRDAKVKGKRVLLRLDTDVPVRDNRVIDDYRLFVALPTIRFLQEQKAKIVIIGHRGRPREDDKEHFSLGPVAGALSLLIGQDTSLLEGLDVPELKPGEVIILENIRFYKEEEKNDSEFTKRLAKLGDFYVNESFADSQREHASIVGIPRFLPHAAGFQLLDEVEHLRRVLENPKRPVVVILGGAKFEKAQYVEKLLEHADWVLVGGALPRVVSSYCRDDGKVCVAAAHLTPAGYDIDEKSAINFAAIVSQAGTVVWNGPLGKYEEEEFMRGTQIVGDAVAKSDTFTVVGGGDTIAALKKLKLLASVDWISTGGGAMLEFLTKGTLVGIEALKA